MQVPGIPWVTVSELVPNACYGVAWRIDGKWDWDAAIFMSRAEDVLIFRRPEGELRLSVDQIDWLRKAVGVEADRVRAETEVSDSGNT